MDLKDKKSFQLNLSFGNPTLGIALFAVLFLVFLPYLDVPLVENESFFGCVAQQMERGAILYRDIWDHKPPFLFWEYIFLRQIFGKGELGIHLAAMANLFVVALLLVGLSRKLGLNRRDAWLAAFLYVVFQASPFFLGWTLQADLLMQPFLIVAIWLSLYKNTWKWLLCGFCFGGALFIKQTAIFYVPVFFVGLYLHRTSGQVIGGRLAKINALVAFAVKKSQFLMLLLGIDFILILCALPFLLNGLARDLWQAVSGSGFNETYITFGWNYARHNQYIIFKLLFTLFLGYFLPLLTTNIILKKTNFKPRADDKWLDHKHLILLWLGVSTISCLVSGFFFSYYFQVILPPLAILLGKNIGTLLDVKPSYGKLAAILIILINSLLAMTVWQKGATKYLTDAYWSDSLVAPREIGAFLSAASSPGDDLYVWGNQGGYNFYSQLPMKVSRTIFYHHLAGLPGEMQRLQKRFEEHKPKYVLVSHESGFAEMPDWLKSSLAKEYVPIARMGQRKIYEIFKYHIRNHIRSLKSEPVL